MKVRDSKDNAKWRELPKCARCRRDVFTLWAGELCITCSRNEILQENMPPPEPTLFN